MSTSNEFPQNHESFVNAHEILLPNGERVSIAPLALGLSDLKSALQDARIHIVHRGFSGLAELEAGNKAVLAQRSIRPTILLPYPAPEQKASTWKTAREANPGEIKIVWAQADVPLIAALDDSSTEENPIRGAVLKINGAVPAETRRTPEGFVTQELLEVKKQQDILAALGITPEIAKAMRAQGSAGEFTGGFFQTEVGDIVLFIPRFEPKNAAPTLQITSDAANALLDAALERVNSRK